MALCEALYPPLQIAEIALRNTIHNVLTNREKTAAWYESIAGLLPWQQQQVYAAQSRLRKDVKPATPGRVIAELHFGFWTCFVNKHHARNGIGYALASQAFTQAPRAERDMRKLDSRLTRIRDLRNRVFHHERIIHWKDLDRQHEDILELIAWISPELHDLALALTRYAVIRKAGLEPWIEKLRNRWPESGPIGACGSL